MRPHEINRERCDSFQMLVLWQYFLGQKYTYTHAYKRAHSVLHKQTAISYTKTCSLSQPKAYDLSLLEHHHIEASCDVIVVCSAFHIPCMAVDFSCATCLCSQFVAVLCFGVYAPSSLVLRAHLYLYRTFLFSFLLLLEQLVHSGVVIVVCNRVCAMHL